MEKCGLTRMPAVVAGPVAGRKYGWVILLLAVSLISVLVTPVSVPAQRMRMGNQAEAAIDEATKAAVIDSISKALNDVYVFPEVAEKMEKKLRANLRAKTYRKISTYQEFTSRLTEDLMDVAHDKHLRVLYSPERPPGYARGDSLTEDEQGALVERWAYENFGFAKLERLSGNIGYLDLRGFHDATWGGKTAVAAMSFLSNSDAIIIDLRRNGGGEPSMIQLISSYFFKEPVHLNSFYIRDEDKMRQFWSHAHVDGPRMTDTPLYVLTSANTFSAAEEFTYNMKNLKRATIVGDTTGGGAHPVRFIRFDDLKVSMSLPFGRAVNPVTGTNWEGTGVEPDIQVPEEQALDRAHLEALRLLVEKAGDAERQRELEWAIAALEAKMNPVAVTQDVLKAYAGVYGPRTITYEDGRLYYQRENNARMRMIPMSAATFMFDEIDFFRLEVETDPAGNPLGLIGRYSNGFTDRSPRTE
jgi:hypothetical protein